MRNGNVAKLSLASEVHDNGASPHGVDLAYLMRALMKYSASDLHLRSGRPPLYRISGKLVAAKMEPLSSDAIQTMLANLLTEQQIQQLERDKQVDLSVHIHEIGRFRCSVFYQRNSVAAVFRMIPVAVPGFEDLGLPPVLKDLCHRPRGLILVTGPTGSGKSTTLAGLVQFINETRHVHILTIEDPIEYVFRDFKGSVTQREVGSDTPSFEAALRGGLRQDPDVVVIGELRDLETIQTALHAAETGHLVLATLHTNNSSATIERLLAMFPEQKQNQIRIQLANTLLGIVSQQLVMRADGAGRVIACEMLVRSPAIQEAILKNNLDQIPEALESSNTHYRMQSLDRDLERLTQTGTITVEEALKVATSPANLKMRLQGIQRVA